MSLSAALPPASRSLPSSPLTSPHFPPAVVDVVAGAEEDPARDVAAVDDYVGGGDIEIAGDVADDGTVVGEDDPAVLRADRCEAAAYRRAGRIADFVVRPSAVNMSTAVPFELISPAL